MIASLIANWLPARRSGKTSVIALAVLVVVLAAIGAWYALQPSTQPSPDEGRAISESFLIAVREGRGAEAWASTTAEFKSAEGQESFLRSLKKLKFLTQPLEFISTQTVSVQEQPRAEYLFREASSGATVRLVLGQEAGQFRVDRMLTEGQ